MRTWDAEKAYSARRALQLAAEMEAAIATADQQRFDAAYTAAARYMPKKQRGQYHKQFLERMIES